MSKIRFTRVTPALAVASLVAACSSVAGAPADDMAGHATPRSLQASMGRALPRGMSAPPGTYASQEATPATSNAPLQSLIYFGGRVISNVKVLAVNWTSGVATTISSKIGAFYTAVTSSVYFDFMGDEYATVGVRAQDGSFGSTQRIGRGSFGGSFTITPTINATTQISDFNIQAELAAQLDSGALPAPEVDAAGNVNSLYMFNFPAAVHISTYNTGSVAHSCLQYGGYHGTIDYKGKSVPYGVLPDCSAGALATVTYSHELAESVTDPEIGLVDPDLPKGETRPCAWYSYINGVDKGEIGDLCETGGGNSTVAGYTVQNLWSNSQGKCIAFETPLICDGSSTPIPGCRACTAADNGVACNGVRPFCETDPSNAKLGQCVNCTASSQCTAPNSTCNKSTDAMDDVCINASACSTNADCTATHATPFCDQTSHQCRACVDADCSGAKPACEKSNLYVQYGQCVQCAEGNTSACTGATPVCDLYTSVCVGCMLDADCGTGGTCQLPAHTCLGGTRPDGGTPTDAGSDSGTVVDAGGGNDAGGVSGGGGGGGAGGGGGGGGGAGGGGGGGGAGGGGGGAGGGGGGSGGGGGGAGGGGGGAGGDAGHAVDSGAPAHDAGGGNDAGGGGIGDTGRAGSVLAELSSGWSHWSGAVVGSEGPAGVPFSASAKRRVEA
jgi:hypothetical protein